MIRFHKTADGQLLDQNNHRFAWFGWGAKRGCSQHVSTKDRDIYLTLAAAAPEMRRTLNRVAQAMHALTLVKLSPADRPTCGWCSGAEDNHAAGCLYAEVLQALALAEGRGGR